MLRKAMWNVCVALTAACYRAITLLELHFAYPPNYLYANELWGLYGYNSISIFSKNGAKIIETAPERAVWCLAK